MSKSLTIIDAIKSGSTIPIVLESIIQNDVARTYTSDLQIPDLGEVTARIASFSGAYIKQDGSNSPTADINWGGVNINNLAYLRDAANVASIGSNTRELISTSLGAVLKWNNGVQVSTNGKFALLDTSLLTADRLVKFQDKAYTGVADLTDITALSSVYQALSAKGSANGYAGLDSSGYVPLSQINPSLIGAVEYQGTWNASTNTPTLATGTGTKGYYYVVSVAGSTTIDGVSSWAIGDWLVYDGVRWDKINNVQGITTITGVNSNGFTWSIANPSTAPALTLTLQAASGSQDGRLIAADWTTFNNKQNALGFTPFANPMTAVGDTIIGSASGVATRLPAGTNGYVYTMVSGSPAWAPGSAGITTPALPATTGTVSFIFDGIRNYIKGIQTGAINFASTGTTEGAQFLAVIDGNGVNTGTFPANWINTGGNVFDTTRRNRIFGQYSSGEVLYAITNSIAPDVTPPSFVSAIVTTAQPTVITITMSETLDATTGLSPSDFTISPTKTISSVVFSGPRIIVTVSAAFTSADTITITGGANKIKDPSGNIATNFSAQAVTNNIGVLILSDTFTRANNASSMGNLETPSTLAWIPETGTWGIIGNQAYCSSALSTGGVVVNRAYADSGVSDYTFTFKFTPGAGNSIVEQTFRYVGTSDYWGFQMDVANNIVKLFNRVGGSITTTNTNAITLSAGTVYTMKTVASGSSISCYINNVLQFSTTNTALQSATKVGITQGSGSPYNGNTDRFKDVSVV